MSNENTTLKHNIATHQQGNGRIMLAVGEAINGVQMVHDVTFDADGQIHHQTLWGRTGEDEHTVGFSRSRFEVLIRGTDDRQGRAVDTYI